MESMGKKFVRRLKEEYRTVYPHEFTTWYKRLQVISRILLLTAFVCLVALVAWSVADLTGKYEWKFRPWVRLQAAEVIVESTLVVQDSTLCDFYMPDDSATAHLAGWADSSNFALNADSLGGAIVPDDILLSSRIDSTSNAFYFLNQTYMKDHINLDQNKYIFFKNSSTSYMRFNNSTNQMQIGSKDGIAFHVWAETLLMTSMAEAGPCAIFKDSTGDAVMTIYNEGGITLAKDWQGMGIWSGTNAMETLAVVGISTASIALVSPCNSDNGFMSWDCWADTCTVTRSAALAQDSFGYLIVK